MRSLVLVSHFPRSRTSGYDVRVLHLCDETPGDVHLAVVPLVPDLDLDYDPGVEKGRFASVVTVMGLEASSASDLRYLRWHDGQYLRLAHGRAFVDVRRQLRALVRELEVDQVIVFGQDLAELGRDLDAPRVVLDVCDSYALIQRRELEVLQTGLRDRVKRRLALARTRSHEARLTRQFDTVVTISAQDSQQVRELGRRDATVFTIPNGVDKTFLTGMLPPGRRRGVAFWGNLGFGPNQQAIRFFLDEVYFPHLAAARVEVRVIGPHAPPWLHKRAASDPRIEVLGYVSDLREALADFPVTVNPMRTGSGLKNKVLEAFGLGLVVVTTTRGIEALPEVKSGSHAVVADEGSAFAAAVLALLADDVSRAQLRNDAHDLLTSRYQWSIVGESWREALGVAGHHVPPPRES